MVLTVLKILLEIYRLTFVLVLVCSQKLCWTEKGIFVLFELDKTNIWTFPW
jgi:hypothetical protein